ncbi:MAG: dimethyl sulfoxide reductase anchor subunit family protein [Burkholderiaceae bacterium]
MKPALSVIFFTVSSGAGLGLAIWLVLAQWGWAAAGGAPAADHPLLQWSGGLSLVLVLAGLMSSTQHLANPRNAWRSLARIRSSWLSREALCALLWLPAALLHGVLSQRGASITALTGALLLVLSVATVICTAMIYACLRTVPRWRTWHTPVIYLLHALVSGGLLWALLRQATGAPGGLSNGGLLLSLLALTLTVTLLFEAKFSERVTATLNQAIGVPVEAAAGHVQGRVRLLDTGHAHRTFLTDEFGFVVAREQALRLRALMVLLTTVFPVLLLLLAPPVAPVLAAVALMFLSGVLIHRWLFFAQAEHVVRLYHGQSRV